MDRETKSIRQKFTIFQRRINYSLINTMTKASIKNIVKYYKASISVKITVQPHILISDLPRFNNHIKKQQKCFQTLRIYPVSIEGKTEALLKQICCNFFLNLKNVRNFVLAFFFFFFFLITVTTS